jgi:hypothetical protein
MHRVNANFSENFSQATEATRRDVKAELTLYLEGRSGWVAFSEIESEVNSLSGVAVGHIHQACFDSGFTRVEI